MTTAVLVSSFDLFNVSDIDLITQARTLCDRLIVAVLSDNDVQAATGAPPVVPAAGRMSLLGHVRGVDGVEEADSQHPRWGEGSWDIVLTSTLAESIRSGDVVIMPSRRSASALMSQLGRRAQGSSAAGVAT